MEEDDKIIDKGYYNTHISAEDFYTVSNSFNQQGYIVRCIDEIGKKVIVDNLVYRKSVDGYVTTIEAKFQLGSSITLSNSNISEGGAFLKEEIKKRLVNDLYHIIYRDLEKALVSNLYPTFK